MKNKVHIAWAVFALVITIALSTFAQKKSTKQPFETDLGNVTVGSPTTHESLTIYPLIATGDQAEFDFYSLDQAMKKRKLRVKEWGSGSVPKLKVRSDGKKKTFIMAGEIVTGAKQDRMSAHDILIRENSRVFCMPV